MGESKRLLSGVMTAGGVETVSGGRAPQEFRDDLPVRHSKSLERFHYAIHMALGIFMLDDHSHRL